MTIIFSGKQNRKIHMLCQKEIDPSNGFVPAPLPYTHSARVGAARHAQPGPSPLSPPRGQRAFTLPRPSPDPAAG